MSPVESAELAKLHESFSVHVAQEEGQFALLQARLDDIAETLAKHVAEHDEIRKRWVGLVFTLIGAAVLAVGSWVKGQLVLAGGR